MVHAFITILFLAAYVLLQGEHLRGNGTALRFGRIGGRLTRVFPHLEWYPHSGGTFPLRSAAQVAHKIILLVKWKKVPHEKRYYHQLNSERTPYCHS